MLLYFILSIVSHFQFLESSFFSKRVEIEFKKKCGHETVWYRISLLPCFEELERYGIVIWNAKIVWKREPYCWHFRLNLKYLRWQYRVYIKIAKNGDFCEEWLGENDFEAVLVTFWYCDHGDKAPEAVQKIATDQKEYRKCSSCAIICWIAKIYLSINNCEK